MLRFASTSGLLFALSSAGALAAAVLVFADYRRSERAKKPSPGIHDGRSEVVWFVVAPLLLCALVVLSL
ncbi:MAG: hypothetical protein ACE5E4_04985 [Candidatus Binatia bacterium]